MLCGRPSKVIPYDTKIERQVPLYQSFIYLERKTGLKPATLSLEG